MRTAIAKLQSVSPLSQGRFFSIENPKLPKENHEEYEKRTWRDRLHSNEEGYVFLPPFAFKNCLDEAAKFIGKQIPGKGKSTYTKHFQAGVLVTDPLVLPIKKEEVDGEWRHVPSDGVPGSGKRVMKCFPVIKKWGGEVEFHVLDDTITLDVLQEHLEQAGQFIGVGSFRPRNRGIYGRFAVKNLKWK